MIVGGVAVALHGYFRKSINPAGKVIDKPDLDFWYNPTYKNYFNLLSALEELGQNTEDFKREKTPNPKKSFFRYDFEKFTLDFLPVLKSEIKFRSSFQKREIVRLREIEISFISYDDLLSDKQSNARPKDLADIEKLRTRQKKK